MCVCGGGGLNHKEKDNINETEWLQLADRKYSRKSESHTSGWSRLSLDKDWALASLWGL